MPTTKTGGAKRGFAAMDPAKQREIASKGGKASHGGGRRSAASRLADGGARQPAPLLFRSRNACAASALDRLNVPFGPQQA